MERNDEGDAQAEDEGRANGFGLGDRSVHAVGVNQYASLQVANEIEMNNYIGKLVNPLQAQERLESEGARLQQRGQDTHTITKFDDGRSDDL